MLRPRASFLATVEQRRAGGGAWVLLRRPIQLGLIFGAFVSFTTTGRLTLRLLLDGLVFWSFIPAMNVAVGLALARYSPARLGASRTTDLLFATFGPWMVWMLAVSGLAAFRPGTVSDPWSVPAWLFPSSVLAAMVWSAWIQHRFHRVALGVSPIRAVLLLGSLKLLVWGAIVAWFALTDQIEPRLPQLLEF